MLTESPSLYGAGDSAQGFVQARQERYRLSSIPQSCVVLPGDLEFLQRLLWAMTAIELPPLTLTLGVPITDGRFGEAL